MKRLNKCLLATMLALSGLAGAITATAQNEKAKCAEAVSLSTLASRQLSWSTATSDANFEWSAALRTVNDFNAVDWVGIRTQYLVNNFTWKYKNNEQNIVDSMTFTKMFFVAADSSVNLSVTLSTLVGGVEKKTQNIPITHLSYPETHWLCDEVVTVTGLSSLVGNKDVTFKFQTSGGNASIGFVKDDYFRVSGYASTKVTLDNQGGSDNSSVYLVEGYSMPNVSIPTKEDCEFDGYYSEVEGGGVKYYNADGTPALTTAGNADTLYAKWNLVGTNITLEKEGGTGGSDSALGVKDETLPDIEVPTKSGYTFNGYYEEENGQGTQYYGSDGTSSCIWASDDATATIYASWTIKPEVQTAIDKINAIGDVSYPDSGDKINAARTAYDAVEAADQAGVSNYSVLQAAETAYNNQKQAGVDNVKGLINAIGTVTLDSEDAITTARTAYNALTNEQKALVSNYQTLEAAETRLAELKAAKANADEVVSLINQIGEVSYPDSGDVIKVARDAYDTLTNDDERGFVTNYSTLTAAETRYQQLKEAKEAADPVNALIDAIGEVKYPDSKAAIDEARAAYNALENDDQRSFAHLSILEAAESAYAALRTNAINNTKDLIDAIGTVSYPESGDAIKAARDAYDALLGADKSEITNYGTLTTAEETYKTLKDQAEASVVKELINAIGEVSYPDSNNAIKAAREAYDALSSDAKAHVDNLGVLTAAETEFEAKREAAIAHVEDLIDAIGTVSYPGSKEALDAARTAYDALLGEDKVSVSNYETLSTAETTYDNLKQAGVDAVINSINGIGNVEYTQESKDKIDAARAAYDALTEEQKALVTNYSTLTHDEEVYDHVQEVVEKIEDIGNVDLNSGDEISVAKEAYDNLTDEEKVLIPTYHDTLVAKEEAYTKLVHDNNVGVTCAIVFGILGGLILLVGIAYVLLMFVFNKWIKEGDKAVRVLRFALGSKDGKQRYLAFPCKFAYRNKEEVFNTKEDALK